MTARSASRASTEIRQSASSRSGRAVVEGIVVGWIVLSVAGGSGLRVRPEFIAGIFIIRGQATGARSPSVGSDPARNTGARYFAVDLKDSRHRSRPGKSLSLHIAALFHLRAQCRIEQHTLQTAPDLKYVLRIHQQRCV